jgi:regulator of replication initiation timing
VKDFWTDCSICNGRVRNSLTAIRQHASECAAKKVEEAQLVAVGVIAERNALRVENEQLRAQLGVKRAA